jgi:hypothetical protein
MRTRPSALIVLGLVALLAVAVTVACSSSDSDDASTEAEQSSTEAESTDGENASDGEAEEGDADGSSGAGSADDEMAAFIGTWENAEGGVFKLITFNGDGTATVTNYSDMKSEGTWSIEEGYLEVTSTADETYGAMMIWLTDTEWDWAYEDGTWTMVE